MQSHPISPLGEGDGTSEKPLPAVSNKNSGSSVLAHLQLMRPANMVTALADVLAGFAVAGLVHPEKLPWLLAAGFALYGGGVTMNDFFDRRLDAVERPERPIPSGRASTGSACLLGIGLLLVGIACALRASAVSGMIAAAVALLAVAYDAGVKHIPIAGPLAMGSCRGLDLLLGVSANVDVLQVRWYVAGISVAYIFGITLLSAGEVHGGSRVRAYISSAFLAIAGLATLYMGSSSAIAFGSVGLMVALLAWRVGPAFYRACVQPGAAQIRGAVKAGVISLVFLDASVAAAYQGLWYALGLVALVLVVSRLARLFPVT
jgi:4-hydroxybenzoate polyprenyltransferase